MKRYGPEDPPDPPPDGLFAEPKPKRGEVVYRFQNGSTMHLKGLDEPARVFAPTPLGETFEPEKDGARLGRQFKRVEAVMADGRWRSLFDLAMETGDPTPSVSARLRDMRRAGWKVERRRVNPESGTYQYRATRGNPE